MHRSEWPHTVAGIFPEEHDFWMVVAAYQLRYADGSEVEWWSSSNDITLLVDDVNGAVAESPGL
jgi:hypothetical protein